MPVRISSAVFLIGRRHYREETRPILYDADRRNLTLLRLPKRLQRAGLRRWYLGASFKLPQQHTGQKSSSAARMCIHLWDVNRTPAYIVK